MDVVKVREQARQRARALRARRGARVGGPRGPKPSAAHGTRSGYNRHYKEGTDVCEPCRLAQREYERARRQEKKGSRAAVGR